MWRSGTGADPELFFEELTVGRVFELAETTVDEAEMRAFARRFDPQWYHLDDDAAGTGAFGAVTASGWFTASLFMRSYVDSVLSRAAADASPGVEELRWVAPVYAGDRLTGRLEVLDRVRSRSRPGLGTVTLAGVLSCPARETEVLRIRFRGWFGLREG